jgi:hypothetical protein
MKQQINEIKKMQLLAGLITESEYRESSNESEQDEVNEETTADKMQQMAQYIEMLEQIDRILDETDAQLTNMKQAGSKISADRVIDYVQGQFNKIRSFQ